MGHESKARAMGIVTPSGQPARPINFAGDVLDRFGNVIEEGARILYRTPLDLVYVVQSVTPVLLHPRQIQQGARPMARMRIAAEFDVPVGVGQAMANMVLVMVPLTREQEQELHRQQTAMAAAANGQPTGDSDPPSGEPPTAPEGGSSDEPPTTG